MEKKVVPRKKRGRMAPIIRLAKSEAQRARNRDRWRKRNKKVAADVLGQNIVRANAILHEVKELASTLRPFLQNGAIMLGETWDDLIADQITIALTGTQTRTVFEKNGDVKLDDKGDPVCRTTAVDPRTQVKVRQQLIEFFPKLIPEQSEAPSLDATNVLLKRSLAAFGGAKFTKIEQIEVVASPEIKEAIGVVLDHDAEATVELSSEDA